MIEFTPLRSVRKKGIEISIDTLTTTARKDTLKKYILKEGFSLNKIKSNSRISAKVKKQLFTREVTSAFQVFTPEFKNIILTTPPKLNDQSNYRKYQVTAFGLSQPNNPLHVKAKTNINNLFNKFKVDSFDLSFDTSVPIDEDRLKLFGATTQGSATTLYVNDPMRFSYITKLCYYHKHIKDDLSYPLYRLEATITSNGRLNDMFIPKDEIQELINQVYS